MAKVNVAFIAFRNGSEEELRGYSTSQFTGGMVLFNWSDKMETVMYPVDTIKSISVLQEDE